MSSNNFFELLGRAMVASSNGLKPDGTKAKDAEDFEVSWMDEYNKIEKDTYVGGNKDDDDITNY